MMGAPANASPSLHHIALGAKDVEKLAMFYEKVIELPLVKIHRHPDDTLRSIWLKTGETILMLEATQAHRPPVEGADAGPFLLAFQIDAEQRDAKEKQLLSLGMVIEDSSAYTLYFRDPEGNRLAFSHHPASSSSQL